MINSPFIIEPDFLSPMLCEQISLDIGNVPNYDSADKPVKLEKHILQYEHLIAEKFSTMHSRIEQTYGCIYEGLQKPMFQLYPENAARPAEDVGCENSKFLRRKWVMNKDVDLVGFIWLKDFNSNVPLDSETDVYGGKLEFPAFNFSLVPQRGTLVLFPAGPHFITAISPILLGNLHQIKLNINIKDSDGGKWFYQPKKHPGTWQEWLADFS